MAKLIFVNLPVADVEASAAFYEAVGATKNPQFSNPGVAACMVLSDTIHVMLLSPAFFANFTPKTVPDLKTHAQVLLCLSEDSRADVDARVEAAVAAGGKADPTPTQDHGHMYGRSYEDLDGHIWEIMWMDVAAATEAMNHQQPAAMEPA